MNTTASRGELAKAAFSLFYPIEQKDVGECALLRKKGMEFTTEAWRVGDVGSLCVVHMNAFFGLMQMETAVFAPSNVDAPLFNIDWVSVLGVETQIAELYDVQLKPWPNVYESLFQEICDEVADLEDMERKPNWYDEILYPCSCAKRGRGLTQRLCGLAQDYVACYVAQLTELEPCDSAKKSELVRKFAERLFSEGGVAVQQMTNLFGDEMARRLVVNCMYGVEEEAR